MKKLLLFLSIFCLTKQAFGAEASDYYKLDQVQKDKIIEMHVRKTENQPDMSGYSKYLWKQYREQVVKEIHGLLKYYKNQIPVGKISPKTKQLIQTNDFIYYLLAMNYEELEKDYPEEYNSLKLIKNNLLDDIFSIRSKHLMALDEKLSKGSFYEKNIRHRMLPYCIRARL